MSTRYTISIQAKFWLFSPRNCLMSNVYFTFCFPSELIASALRSLYTPISRFLCLAPSTPWLWSRVVMYPILLLDVNPPATYLPFPWSFVLQRKNSLSSGPPTCIFPFFFGGPTRIIRLWFPFSLLLAQTLETLDIRYVTPVGPFTCITDVQFFN